MILKTKIVGMFGTSIILPIAGEIEVSNQGEIDVDQEVATLLLQGTDWETSESDQITDDNSGTDDLSEEEKKALEDSKKAGISDKEIEDALNGMDLDALVELAKTSKMKGYNLFAKDKSKMVVFLKKKMEETKK